MSDPIEHRYHHLMNGLAAGINKVLNGSDPDQPDKIGFVLLMSEFGRIEGGCVNYISNGERADMIAMLREMLARAEGRFAEDVGHV